MAINTFPIATVAPSANLIINNPAGPISATDVQAAINQLASLIPSPGPGTDPLALIHGETINATNPDVANDPNNHRALDINVTTDSSTTNIGFTDENAVQIQLTATNGQCTNGGGTNSKKTFIPLNIGANYLGSGQKFIMVSTLNSYSMGDAATWGNNVVNYAGGPINGDEGQGWQLVADLRQQNFLATANILTVHTPSGANTVTTQVIVQSNVAQTVTVASTVGINVNDWIIIDQQIPSGAPTLEAVQVISVGPTSITGIFLYNHNNGVSVKPALVLDVDNNYWQMGQDRVLVNMTKPAYTTGTVSSIAGGGFTGSGTVWTDNMVGGNALNVGAISLAADDQTQSPWDTGSKRLRSWYQILNISSNTAMGIMTTSVAGDNAYRGKGPIFGSGNPPTTYTIRQCAKTLRIIGNTLICENSTSTWSVGDAVEQIICPYPDVTGFQYHMASYTPGGTYRGFMGVGNTGMRTIGTAFGCDAAGGGIGGGGGADTVGWNQGFACDSVNTGIVLSNVKVAAMQVPYDPLGGKFVWGSNLSIAPDTTNSGFTLRAASGGPDGFLNFASAGSPSNPEGTRCSIDWNGKIRLGRGAPAILPSLQVFSSVDQVTNFQYAAFEMDPGLGGLFKIQTHNGGTASQMSMRFAISGTDKMQIGCTGDGEDAIYFFSSLVKLKPITFGSQPSVGSGAIAMFSDSTTDVWGATITGGGTKPVLGWFNGSNWTVFGK